MARKLSKKGAGKHLNLQCKQCTREQEPKVGEVEERVPAGVYRYISGQKMARKERENQTKMEEKVDGKAPGDEGAEVQCLKRTVIRVESEETQDHVRESLNLSQEEAEALSFVPSAISIPRGPTFRCDNRCSDKAIRFWQFASVVVGDGEEVHTVNQFVSAVLRNWQWKAVVGKKAHRGRLWRMPGKEQYLRGVWEFFL